MSCPFTRRVGKATAGGDKAFTSAKNFVELIPLDIDLESARQLVLIGKNITAIPPNVGTILRGVRRLDLSSNDVRDAAPLATMRNLTSINLTRNSNLSSIAPLAALRLTVCVVGCCNLRSLVGLEGSTETLKTLVVNDNSLTLQSPVGSCVEGAAAEDIATAEKNYEVIASLTGCETLVLSRNPLLCALHAIRKELEGSRQREKSEGGQGPQHAPDLQHPLSAIAKMTSLKKLSLSGCGLTTLPQHWFFPKVTELRLSRNKLRSLVPEGVLFRSVKILDVSHNELGDASTLRRFRFVHHLSIRGNAFLEKGNGSLSRRKDEEGAHVEETNVNALPTIKPLGEVLHYLMRIMPHLEIVDSTPIAELLRANREDERGETVRSEPEEDAECTRSLTDGVMSGVQEADRVVDPPEAPGQVKATIVRREQTNLLSTRKRKLSAEGAAVAQMILKRKTEASGW